MFQKASSKFVGLLFLVMIIGSMVLSTVLPALQSANGSAADSDTQNFAEPTAAIVSFPTPNPDGYTLPPVDTVVHPAALFALGQPQGWTPSTSTQGGVASISMVNSTVYSVIHAYIQQYEFAQDVPALDAEFQDDVLAASWSEYDGWVETAREASEAQLIIDFELTLGENTYLARQFTRPLAADPTWAVVMRLVAPGNNPDLLDSLQADIIPSFVELPDGLAAPLEWETYFDRIGGYAIRYAPGWALVDGGPGRPVTLSDAERGFTLTLDFAPDGALEDEDAVTAWVEAARLDAEVIDIVPVSRAFGDGYAVAFTFSDMDGAAQGGFAVLVNGPDGRLLSASLRMPDLPINLLDNADSEPYPDLLTMVESFAPLPEVLIQAPPEPTATPDDSDSE